MTHPKSESILRVIDAFKKVLPMATQANHLRMMNGCVNVANECGTVHCHGGWFAIATCDLKMSLDFTDGANKMAEWLGFTNMDHLACWASRNPEVWGNHFGRAMFCDKLAFIHPTNRPDGAKNLQCAIDHWTEVYERVRALEEQEVKASVASKEDSKPEAGYIKEFSPVTYKKIKELIPQLSNS